MQLAKPHVSSRPLKAGVGVVLGKTLKLFLVSCPSICFYVLQNAISLMERLQFN